MFSKEFSGVSIGFEKSFNAFQRFSAWFEGVSGRFQGSGGVIRSGYRRVFKSFKEVQGCLSIV